MYFWETRSFLNMGEEFGDQGGGERWWVFISEAAAE